ncbi:MAG: hypothetical protein MK486_21495 [Gemmatimonadetes bacterium]|nr:hypothetical protein [Gemmatimonadota bacterium]HIN09997.1 hypothetical protein [Acidobacteriota bacterium]
MTGGRSTLRPLSWAFVVLVAWPALTMAQDVPQTAWGAPDLQGVWDFRTITPLERPENLGDKAFLTQEEAAQREQSAVDRATRLWDREARRTEAGGNVGGYNNFWMDQGTNVIGTRRTSLIIDPPNGRLPEVTETGRARAAANRGSFSSDLPASYTDLSNSDRCLMGFNAGPPITPAAYNQNVQLFQTPDHLVMLTEMVHTVRVIPLDGTPPLVEGLRQLSGDSRGHWEGKTLVVETANFEARRDWRGSTEGMRLVERFTRVDADTLEYEFTVTDPETWDAPWTVNLPMRRNEFQMFEYACHEGNYSMEAMLGGARADERTEGGQ